MKLIAYIFMLLLLSSEAFSDPVMTKREGPFVREILIPQTVRLPIPEKDLKAGFVTDIKMNAGKNKQTYYNETWSETIGGRDAKSVKEFISKSEVIPFPPVDVRIALNQPSVYLNGEEIPKIEIVYDGKRIFVAISASPDCPFDVKKLVDGADTKYNVNLTFIRRKASVPSNDLVGELKQEGSELVLYLANTSCDEQDTSKIYIEGQLYRERYMPLWWWTPVYSFHAELKDQACKENKLILSKAPIISKYRVEARFRIFKEGELFGERPSVTKSTADIKPY